MRMTKDQAIAYCHSMAERALDGKPSGAERSLLWTRIREQIEREGLQKVEEDCTRWRDEHTGITAHRDNITWTLYGTFLNALEDNEEIERLIAADLIPRAQGEIVEDQWVSLRAYYLSCFRQHLVNVCEGASNLTDYEEVRERIEDDLRKLEGEYGMWIDEAVKNQE